MISDRDWQDWITRETIMRDVHDFLSKESGTPTQVNPILEPSGQALVSDRVRWIQVLRRPGIDPEAFFKVACPDKKMTRRDQWFLYSEEIYAGFFERQLREIEHQKKMEKIRLSPDIDYMSISALSIEARQKLMAQKPLTMGQVSHIPGVRQADITVLAHWFETSK
ncbi:MAG TPA: hypothetical protein PK366_08775 [Fibrobacteraceae bacterium]|nr:hypothetical protein [Fibrobacteraceae bacterium]